MDPSQVGSVMVFQGFIPFFIVSIGPSFIDLKMVKLLVRLQLKVTSLKIM